MAKLGQLDHPLLEHSYVGLSAQEIEERVLRLSIGFDSAAEVKWLECENDFLLHSFVQCATLSIDRVAKEAPR